MKILITGGVRSGKSSYALRLAKQQFSGIKVFLATTIPFDEEMKRRVEEHKRQRDKSYRTAEEPVEIHNEVAENLILDCVTMWINNLFHYQKQHRWEEILSQFLSGLGENAIIVTNEVGWGNIPVDSQVRQYNELLGISNQMIASHMDEVYLMVAGIPVKIKG
jgi:adenosylcobinamide kinase/adenosylcobinamide-phosphate guanylyltransferase